MTNQGLMLIGATIPYCLSTLLVPSPDNALRPHGHCQRRQGLQLCQSSWKNAEVCQPVQITATQHSKDERVDTTAMAINAISAALMDSQIPWSGPVAAVRVALQGEEIIVSPSTNALAEVDSSMLYVGRGADAVMIDMQVRCLS